MLALAKIPDQAFVIKRYANLHTLGRARLSAGFSLVEIMVGMVMGLMAMIVILQMLTVFEGQKRTTTGGNDAQNSGAIALHILQQDIAQAGYGISESGLLNCSASFSGVAIPLAPVTINPPVGTIPLGDANTDRMLVFYGNSNGIAEGSVLSAQAGQVYSVNVPSSFINGDRVIATATPCVGTLAVDSVSGVPALQTLTVATGVVVTVPATLYNLGQAPQMLAYAIRGGNLTVCDYLVSNCGNSALTGNSSVWLPIANNIVSMKVQYLHSSVASTPVRTQAQIDAIVNTVPRSPRPNYVVDTPDQTTPVSACGWARTPAIRLALIARGQYEKSATTTTVAPIWAGTAGAAIDLSADGNWTNYRYQVLETVVPIRNVNWMGVQAGC